MVYYFSLISWLTWQLWKFSTYENAYGGGLLCEFQMMGVAKTLWQHSQLFSVLTNNSSHCHPVDDIFDTNILSISLRIWLRRLWARSSACIDYITCAVPHPWTGLLSQNLKPWKLILRAFWYHENWHPRKLPAIGIRMQNPQHIAIAIASLHVANLQAKPSNTFTVQF